MVARRFWLTGRTPILCVLSFLLTLVGSVRAQVQLYSAPGPAAQLPNTSGLTAEWDFQNTGSTEQSLDLACYTGGRVTSCSVPSSQVLPAFGIIPVRVTFSTGTPGAGSIGLSAFCHLCSFSYQGGPTYAVQDFGVSVTPHASTGAVEPTRQANSTGFSTTFAVRNAGSTADTYSLTCSASGGVFCHPISPSTVNLAPGSTATSSVQYDLRQLVPQSNNFPSGNAIVSVGGTTSVTLNPGAAYDSTYTVQYSVSVTINGSSSQYGSASLGVSIETNDGSGWVQRAGPGYNCGYPSGPPPYSATTCSWPHEQPAIKVGGLGLNSTIRLNVTSFSTSNGAGGSFQVSGGSGSVYPGVTYTAFAAPIADTAATGMLAITAAGTYSTDSGSFTVPIAASGGPVVDFTPYNFATQDYRRCAAQCFATVYTLSAVPYYSFGAARSVTLTYNSDRVNPRPFVHINVNGVFPGGPGTPTEYRLQVKVNGAFVTFLNGDQTLRFTYQGPGNVRLGGQFDASGYATNAYPMNIIVSAYYAGSPGTLITTALSTKLIVVNETSSPVAGGWTLGAIQRLYSQTDGSAVVADENGSALYFAKAGSGFWAPPGEYSSLVGSGGWTRKYLDGSRAVFDNTGRMTQLLDRFGNSISVAYDANGRVAKVTDPAGLRDTLVYGANGLATITDPGSPARTTNVTVNASRALSAWTDPDGVATQFSFDANLSLWKVINRRGDTTQYGYDSPYDSRKMVFVTYPKVPIIGAGTVSPTQSRYPWQTVGVPASSTAGTPATAPLVDTVQARINDAIGYTTSFSVDRFGTATRMTDAAGAITTFTRDGDSRVIRESSPSGRVVLRSWSGPNVTQLRDSVAYRTINYVYEPGWNELAQIYGDADSVWYYWSAGHRDSIVAGTRAVTSPLRRYAVFTYDAFGRLITGVDPGGHPDTTFYAAAGGRNTDSTRSMGRRIAYTYDAYGRRATTKTPRNDVTILKYDVLNRRDTVIGPMADTTIFIYDSLFLRTVRDAIGQSNQYAYNALGWLTSRTDPTGAYRQFQYDRNGNILQGTNRRGQAITWVYDALNRATSVTADGKTTTFTHDAQDRYVADSSAESIDTVRFDVLGRVTSQITVRGTTRYELVSDWDYRDKRIMLRSVSPWSDTIAYHYNASLVLDSLRDVAGGRTALLYDRHLLDSLKILPNGLQITRQWPAAHGSAQITYNVGAVTSAIGIKYTYDTLLALLQDAHRVTSTNDVAPSGRDYSYDAAGRLASYGDYSVGSVPTSCQQYAPDVGWCHGGVPGKTYSTQVFYSYDKVGNRTDMGAYVAPGSGNRLVRFNGDSLVYDADGNMITRIRSGAPIQQLYWSSIGRLDSVWTNGVGIVRFGYDGAGRRVRKSVGSTTTRYILDGDQLFAEVDGGTPTTPVVEYTYYPGIDRPHSLRRRMRSDSVFYFAEEVPGSVVGLTNGSAVLVNQYRYTPFGADNAGFPQGAVPNSLRFAAREFDPETGLYYMRARYYDPQLARFISEDPSGLGAGVNLTTGQFIKGDPVGLGGGNNLYTFGGQSPVNYLDPFGTGLFSWVGSWVGAIVGFVAAVVTGGLPAALIATIATASGSAFAAGVESLLNGSSFGDAFRRNFNISELFLGASAVAAKYWGQGIKKMGGHLFQGFVQSNGRITILPKILQGGLTMGSASAFNNALLDGNQGTFILASFARHEFGHVLQFVGLSKWGNPWWTYLGLGAVGLICPNYNPWENLASGLGHTASGGGGEWINHDVKGC